MNYGKDWASLLDRTIWQQIYVDERTFEKQTKKVTAQMDIPIEKLQ